MNASIIIGIIELILKVAPGAVPAIQALLNKKDPTAEDFTAAKQQIEKDTFASLVPNADKFQAPPAA